MSLRWAGAKCRTGAPKAHDWYDEQAKERQKRKPAKSVLENLPEQKSSARDAVGKAIGVSGKSIDNAGDGSRPGTANQAAAFSAPNCLY